MSLRIWPGLIVKPPYPSSRSISGCEIGSAGNTVFILIAAFAARIESSTDERSGERIERFLDRTGWIASLVSKLCVTHWQNVEAAAR